MLVDRAELGEPSDGSVITKDAFLPLTHYPRSNLSCKTPTVVCVPPKHHFGRSPEGNQHGTTHSQSGQSMQEPVATRALLMSKGQHRAPSKATGHKHTPQHRPALTSMPTSGRSATSTTTLHHRPESPWDGDPWAGERGWSASPLG